MILDSSAVVAILVREPDFERLLDRLTPGAGIGAPTLVEIGIVVTRKLGSHGRTSLAGFLQESEVVTVPFTDDHWRVGLDAFLRFGKGRHPAALNFGDCLTYATARLAGEPLLCRGEDFARTDLALA